VITRNALRLTESFACVSNHGEKSPRVQASRRSARGCHRPSPGKVSGGILFPGLSIVASFSMRFVLACQLHTESRFGESTGRFRGRRTGNSFLDAVPYFSLAGPGFQGANFGKASIQNGSLGGVHLSLAVHCLVASYQASKHAPFSSQVRSHNVARKSSRMFSIQKK
jgi:hypothetical protein